MKQTFPLTFSILTVLCLFSFSASADNLDEEARHALMDKAMDCIASSAQKGVEWNDVCYTSSESPYADKDRLVTKSLEQMVDEHNTEAQNAKSVDTIIPEHQEYSDTYSKSLDDVIEEQGINNETAPASNDNLDSSRDNKPYVQYAQATQNDYPTYTPPSSARADFSPQGNLRQSHRPLNDRLQNQNKAEIGIEYMRFRYTEPIFDLVDNGNLFGGYASYTARPGESDGLYDDIIDMYKVEARFNYGHVDYQSSGSGTLDDIPDWTFEGRILAGKDIPIFTDSRLTPYIGLGLRFLNDNSSGMLTNLGFAGYERESRYFYLPIGVEFTTAIADGWIMTPSAEFDVFLSGEQKSHIEDVDPAAPTVKNDQDNGFGVRGSLKFIKENDPVNFVFEPYIRYWHVKDSVIVAAAGSLWQEPENTSTEYGVRLGAQF